MRYDRLLLLVGTISVIGSIALIRACMPPVRPWPGSVDISPPRRGSLSDASGGASIIQPQPASASHDRRDRPQPPHSTILATRPIRQGTRALVPLTQRLDALPAPREAPVIWRVATRHPYVALTIDDFYTADYRHMTAIQMLAAANVAHARLTLCPAGNALNAYTRRFPSQAAQIKFLVATGSYELCNHTLSHPVLPRLAVTAIAKEITAGAAAMRAFFGRSPDPILRPPYGRWNAATQQAAWMSGYRAIITWSIDSGDSEGPELPAAQLVAHVARAGPGDIILMHANRESSARALPLIITTLRAKGLELVDLATLLASGQPRYVSGG